MPDMREEPPVLKTAPIVEKNPDRIDNPILQFFLSYWRDKRGARAMPARGDLVLREIKQYLGWVCLLDALPGYTDFRYRLVGSFVSEYFLDDGTGRTVSDVFGNNDYLRKGALWVFRKTCTGREPIRLRSPGGELSGRYHPEQ